MFSWSFPAMGGFLEYYLKHPMGRPNYQRILNAHGTLPLALQKDFGLKVLESEADGTQEVLEQPTEKELAKLRSTKETKFTDLVDAESGKKLVEMTWAELRAKAVKHEIFSTGMKKQEILEAFLERAKDVIPEEVVTPPGVEGEAETKVLFGEGK
jgi:hypothetical protein